VKDLNAKSCCLVGHPEYYRQFGLENVAGLVHDGAPQEVFLALSFDGHMPQGNAPDALTGERTSWQISHRIIRHAGLEVLLGKILMLA
jgi:hypothetical protein